MTSEIDFAVKYSLEVCSFFMGALALHFPEIIGLYAALSFAHNKSNPEVRKRKCWRSLIVTEIIAVLSGGVHTAKHIVIRHFKSVVYIKGNLLWWN